MSELQRQAEACREIRAYIQDGADLYRAYDSQLHSYSAVSTAIHGHVWRRLARQLCVRYCEAKY